MPEGLLSKKQQKERKSKEVRKEGQGLPHRNRQHKQALWREESRALRAVLFAREKAQFKSMPSINLQMYVPIGSRFSRRPEIDKQMQPAGGVGIDLWVLR